MKEPKSFRRMQGTNIAQHVHLCLQVGKRLTNPHGHNLFPALDFKITMANITVLLSIFSDSHGTCPLNAAWAHNQLSGGSSDCQSMHN